MIASVPRDPLPALVSTAWLAERLGRPDLRVLDASWYLPATGRAAATEYTAGHLPGAIFLDLDAVSDPDSALPHMLPSAERFASVAGSVGVRDVDDVVVYDGSGANLSAGRVWWMFRVFGHARAALLDGGLKQWRREGRPLEVGQVEATPGTFSARLDRSAVRDLRALRDGAGHPPEQVVDARPAGRFAGTDPEPRAGLRGGHIPDSRNVPFDRLVRSDGTLRSPDELRAIFLDAGVDPRRPVVATCGSGTSACTLIHALHLLGNDRATLYDGSWTEWGGRPDTPVATGAAAPR